MKQPERKVISLSKERYKRLVIGAFDKLKDEDRRIEKDKETEIRIAAKHKL